MSSTEQFRTSLFPTKVLSIKHGVLFALCLLLVGPALRAQDATPPPQPARSVAPAAASNIPGYDNRWDVYGGFAYAHFNGVGKVRATNLLGWNGQVTGWIKPVFGLAVSGRGNYGTYPVTPNSLGITSPSISQHIFLFGPDFRIWRNPASALGFHVLLGGAYGKFDSGLKGAPPNSLGLYVNQLAFAAATGASFDHHVSPRLSVRFTADFAPTHFGSALQDEFAGSVGVVYKMGSIGGGGGK